jgi:hypothetical protein
VVVVEQKNEALSLRFLPHKTKKFFSREETFLPSCNTSFPLSYILDTFFKICQTISSLLGKEYFPAASLFIEADSFDDDFLSTMYAKRCRALY